MISLRMAKVYCKDFEKVENYLQAANDPVDEWVCHHKLEFFVSGKQLEDMGRYFNVPARELVFIRKSEHQNNTEIHCNHSMKGKHQSKEAKAKQSLNNCHYWQGKKRPEFSDECKKKMSDSHKGKHWKLVDGRRIYF